MAPEANKHAAAVCSGHTVDKVGFHLVRQFKATGHAHNKLAIKANVQLGSGALQRARHLVCGGRSHASASSHHIV